MLKLNNSDFPILWINNSDKSLGVFKDSEDLTTCVNGTLSSKWYFELSLVTFSKRLLIVQDVKKIKSKPASDLTTLFCKILGFGEIIVSFELEEQKCRINVNKLKENIKGILLSCVDLWDSDGRLEWLLAVLEETSSVDEIVMLMKKRNFCEEF